MTFVHSFAIQPPQRGEQMVAGSFDLANLSLVVPVKNNQEGIRQLLQACLDVFTPGHCPREIIVVDNGSSPPLVVPNLVPWDVPLRLLVCSRPGPAAARNLGAKHATGEWVLFLDSDCQPTPALMKGYQHAWNGSIAYAGAVCAAQRDPLSRYYETQQIFSPPSLWENGVERPAYLITANALVWLPAFTSLGGFDERFPEAGGEDVDLGLRLWQVGPLSYAPHAQVLHRTEPDLGSFVRRFVRYGRANRLLSARYQADLAPRRMRPQERAFLSSLFAALQFCALWWGYWGTSLSAFVFPFPKETS